MEWSEQSFLPRPREPCARPPRLAEAAGRTYPCVCAQGLFRAHAFTGPLDSSIILVSWHCGSYFAVAAPELRGSRCKWTKEHSSICLCADAAPIHCASWTFIYIWCAAFRCGIMFFWCEATRFLKTCSSQCLKPQESRNKYDQFNMSLHSKR